jgi:hypothetical protein
MSTPTRTSTPPATCDKCGKRRWCRLVSWLDGARKRGGFLCDECRKAIPNELRGWGRDEVSSGG